MKSIPRRRPSPALVISMIALFVSLSGVSYGVATGFIDSRELKNNEIRSLDIRNNQVRSIDLRNNEVRGIDIRNSTVQGRDIALNTVTGEDLNETTIGKVPSATSADTAASATTATTAQGVSTLKVIPRTAVPESAGVALVPLATQGPLTLLAQCGTGGVETIAELFVETSEDNSASGGEATAPVDDVVPRLNPDLDASDNEITIMALNDPVGGERSVTVAQVFASAPSGKGFTGQMAMYADTAANSCVFHGHLALQG
ncbi:MAG TPA: hypothetical protein VF056_02945 [Thermoleophilaceae bacterium]